MSYESNEPKSTSLTQRVLALATALTAAAPGTAMANESVDRSVVPADRIEAVAEQPSLADTQEVLSRWHDILKANAEKISELAAELRALADEEGAFLNSQLTDQLVSVRYGIEANIDRVLSLTAEVASQQDGTGMAKTFAQQEEVTGTVREALAELAAAAAVLAGQTEGDHNADYIRDIFKEYMD